MMTNKPSLAKRDKNLSTGFVVDGYERAIDGIEAEIRPKIEGKYAEKWNTSGLIKRWIISRKIEKEITELVAERSKCISPDSQF
jgi:hypothetical protein